METIREAQERNIPVNLEAHKDGRVKGETAHAGGSEPHYSNNGQVKGTGR